jgi:hypothetical protein
MLIILLGALLILGGVVFMAEQTLLGGRLSGRVRRSPAAVGTLEPRERGGGFGLRRQWPGFAMVAAGALLLLAATTL